MRNQAISAEGQDGTAADGAALRLAALAKALGHPARLEILRTLHRRRTCIGCDIVEEIGLAQSTTAEHLRLLKAAGIVRGRIERPRVCYSLDRDALRPLRAFLSELIDDGDASGA